MSSEPAGPDPGAGRSLRTLLISHEESAAPAVIGDMLLARGADLHRHVILDPDGTVNTDFPNLDDFDLVVSFGSFHNAYDPEAREWVSAEVELIRDALVRQTPFLGVCFGGQLLGMALGGRVERAPSGAEEVGVVEVRARADSPVPSGPWFAWHEDRIVLPDDPSIEVLADTENAVQVFRAGKALGLQFHPEVDRDLVAEWLRIGEHHLPEGWSAQRLLDVWEAAEPEAHRNCEVLVDWVVDDFVGSAART